jgi:hypothetical protein
MIFLRTDFEKVIHQHSVTEKNQITIICPINLQAKQKPAAAHHELPSASIILTSQNIERSIKKTHQNKRTKNN